MADNQFASGSVPGTGKDKLNINRVVLLVDGVIKADSVLAAGTYFSANQSVTVFWDYIAVGSHTVTLEAYGVLHTYTGKLYSGASTFSAVAGTVKRELMQRREVTHHAIEVARQDQLELQTVGRVGQAKADAGTATDAQSVSLH